MGRTALFQRLHFRWLAVVLAVLLAGSSFVPAVQAKEPASPQLSLQDAIQRALDNSEELKSAQYAVDKAKKQRDDASDEVDYIPAPLSGTPQADVAWSNFLKADYNWQIQKQVLAASRDKVTQDVVQAYYDVILKGTALKKARADLERDQLALQVAKAVYQAGGLPSTGLTGTGGLDSSGLPQGTQASVLAAQAKLQASQKALATAEEDLNKAYVTFNRLVGLWPEDRPVLTEPLIFARLKVDNLDAEAERAVESSKDIAIKEKTKEIAQVDVDYPYTIGITGFTWQELGLTAPEVNIKEQDIAKASNDLRQQVRTLYSDIRSTEERYQALQDALVAAKEALRVAQVTYDAGMTTQQRLKEAEASCAELQNQAEGLTVQHTLQLLGYCLLTGRPVEDGSFFKDVVEPADLGNTVLAPAPVAVGGSAVFKLGENSYTLNGQQVPMDVAPVIELSRVFVPVRFAANAVGVKDEQIKWDPAGQRVTLQKGDDQVELTVGDRRLIKNGRLEAEMDVAPINRSGRVFLPISFLARALGGEVKWDAFNRTVTINY